VRSGSELHWPRVTATKEVKCQDQSGLRLKHEVGRGGSNWEQKKARVVTVLNPNRPSDSAAECRVTAGNHLWNHRVLGISQFRTEADSKLTRSQNTADSDRAASSGHVLLASFVVSSRTQNSVPVAHGMSDWKLGAPWPDSRRFLPCGWHVDRLSLPSALVSC
jgi:hypothetical protein